MFSFALIVTAALCVTTLVLLFGLYVHCKCTLGVCRNTESLVGKTVLITGGSSGIGFEASKEFARRGARLLIACRNADKARAAIAAIERETGHHDISLHYLDTSSLQSVEDLAARLVRPAAADADSDRPPSTTTTIDVLCLHAGAAPAPLRQESVDGLELVFATNYLGHFHLANLLRPCFGPSTRIIITSSMMHEYVRLDFADLQLRRSYGPLRSYAASKLMNVYHMRELSARLSADGIAVNAFHPGIVQTAILGGAPSPTSTPSASAKFTLSLFISTVLHRILLHVIVPIFGKTPWQGAQTLIHLATSAQLAGVTGQYFVDCKPCRLNEVGSDKRAPRRLWDYSEALIEQWRATKQATATAGETATAAASEVVTKATSATIAGAAAAAATTT